jgi:pimeloyl-ACP methyl ester carboxylesterase
MPAMCKTMNVPAVPTAQPTRIEAPALLLSGALDPVTPPHRAATAAKTCRTPSRWWWQHAGHGVSQLGCAPRLLREFLDKPQASSMPPA